MEWTVVNTKMQKRSKFMSDRVVLTYSKDAAQERVQAMYGPSLFCRREDEIVGSAWRHAESGGTRNDLTALFGMVFDNKAVTIADGMYDLLGDSTITTMFQNGAPRGFDDQPEILGYLGEYMGMAIFETTNARIYTSSGATGADVYAALAIARDAYGVTEIDSDGLQTYYQPLGSGGASGDPLSQIGSIGWKVNYTAEILNQAWLLRIEHGATP